MIVEGIKVIIIKINKLKSAKNNSSFLSTKYLFPIVDSTASKMAKPIQPKAMVISINKL